MPIDSQDQLINRIQYDPFFGEAVSFVLNKIGDFRDKVILDSGCGFGEMSVFFALQGARIIGIDKSETAIEGAKKLAFSSHVENKCHFIHGCSETISLENASIDIIFSRSAIQYMDRIKVLDQYMRILKPSGIIVLIENLPFNPFINLYRIRRKITARHPQDIRYIDSICGYITIDDIDRLTTLFRYSDHQEYHFVRMISIYMRLHFNHHNSVKKIDLLLSKVDHFLFDCFPFLRHYAWFAAFYFEEKIR